MCFFEFASETALDARGLGAERRWPLLEAFERFERHNDELLRYEILTDDEKREILDIVGSNFSVCGKDVRITLRNPYREIAEIPIHEQGWHYRDDVRTFRIFNILKRDAEGGNASNWKQAA